MVMGKPESARTTALYHTEDSSQFVTFPITEAVGAMKVSLVWNGFWLRKAILGRWRVITFIVLKVTSEGIINSFNEPGEGMDASQSQNNMK